MVHRAGHIDFTFNSTKRFTHFTPKARCRTTPARRRAYFSLGGGVESPAFNEIDPPAPYDAITAFNPFLEPMVSTTLDLGSRGTLA